MNFLSLAPVASASHSQQTAAKPAIEASVLTTEECVLQRADSTSSEGSNASTSSEGAKQMRFLKLGHSDGDWSEEVIEAWMKPDA